VARHVRRGVQLSRGAPQSGLTGRRIRPEILDELDPADPRAVRSRSDLRRVNHAMGSCGILTRSLRRLLVSCPPRAPLRLLELGAGDGSLALRIARRLAPAWPAAELTLLDRQALIAPATGTGLALLGWTLRPINSDVFEWAQAALDQHLAGRWDIILANLFLHHFEDERVRQLLSAVAMRCDAFIACEPRRSIPALLGARLLPALGASRDTRYDAQVSVRAGFAGAELSRLWPAAPGSWTLQERRAGLFSHLFVASRGADR
jgi:2-polyprenyl-3-methyl-5-hydroxy-6-metoxy-1,4-benzoquinol methylase